MSGKQAEDTTTTTADVENHPKAEHIIDWAHLAALLDDDNTPVTAALTAFAKQFSTGFILHEAICRGAPTYLLQSMVHRFPSLLSQEDGDGRLPLHWMCALGSSPKFVARCIKMNPSSASATDIDGRTPLDTLVARFETSLSAWKLQQVHSMLLRQAPLPAIPEDDELV